MRVHLRPSAEPGCIDLVFTGVPVGRVPEITAFVGREIQVRPVGDRGAKEAPRRPVLAANVQPNVVPRADLRPSAQATEYYYSPYPGEFQEGLLVAEDPTAVAVA